MTKKTFCIFKNTIGLYEVQEWSDDKQKWVTITPWMLANMAEAQSQLNVAVNYASDSGYPVHIGPSRAA
jgi:hypothetical protein